MISTGHPTVRGLAAHLDAGSPAPGPRAPGRRCCAAAPPHRRRQAARRPSLLYGLLLLVTLPVAAVYSLNDGEVSIGVLRQLMMRYRQSTWGSAGSSPPLIRAC